MRQCRFCERWFKNRQAVRRHLGYCQLYLEAPRPAETWTRAPVVQCEQCVVAVGPDHTQRVTQEEMHEFHAEYGGCPSCSGQTWVDAGWRRVRVTAPAVGSVPP